jgi:hypothetical protein
VGNFVQTASGNGTKFQPRIHVSTMAATPDPGRLAALGRLIHPLLIKGVLQGISFATNPDVSPAIAGKRWLLRVLEPP